MKKTTSAMLLACLLFAACKPEPEHKAPPKKFHSKTFDWDITIPENFEVVPADERARLQAKGKTALESTAGQELDIKTKTLFMFRSDRAHYLQASYEPFDTTASGSFEEGLAAVRSLIYNAFVSQMKGADVDSSSSIETINGLKFYRFNTNVSIPQEHVTIHFTMFRHLFNDKELNVALTYIDSLKGEEMLRAFRSSTFGKDMDQGNVN